MATIYRNFLSGTLSADPGVSGTTLNGSNFASLPVVASPDTMWLVLDPDGTIGVPEVVQITAHTSSSTSVTVARGQQSTSPRAHAIGTVWRVAVTSTDLDELPFRKLTTTGDILYGSAANTASRLAIGSSGLPLVSSGTAPQWAQVNTAGIADGAVTTAKIGAAAVTAAKLAADTAGNGLTQAAGGALQVNPDGSTIELSADAVRVKDGGITLAKMAADSVDASKIVNDTITVNEIANDAVTVSKILQGTAGQVLMTNGTPDTAWTTLTGDVTVTSAGVTAIGSGVIVVGDFATGVRPVVICTSSTRPSTGLVEGQMIYETDTDRILSYSGSSWIVENASGSYTPTVDNLTLGTGGTNSAVWGYSRGKLTVSGLITLGTGGAVTGNLLWSYPSGFQADPLYETDHPVGSAFFAGGGSQFAGSVTYNSGTRMKAIVHRYDPTGTNATAYVTISGTGSAIPFSSWASGYDVRWTATVVGTLT